MPGQQDLIAYQQDPAPFEDAYPGFDPAVLTNPLPDSWNTGVNTNWENRDFSERRRSATCNCLPVAEMIKRNFLLQEIILISRVS